MTSKINEPTLIKKLYPYDKPCPIEFMEVRGLYGNQNLNLTFSNSYTVFVAENGSGKTTALFILQSILRSDYAGLLRTKFSEVLIKFSGEDVLKIPFKEFFPKRYDTVIRRIFGSKFIDTERGRHILNLINHSSFDEARNDKDFLSLSNKMGIPIGALYRRVRDLSDIYSKEESGISLQKEKSSITKILLDSINKHFPYEVLYLPTYRRVEQDLKTVLNIDENDQVVSQFINFGMKDVEKRINVVTEKIRDHFVMSYGQINGQMIDRLTEGVEITAEMRAAIANEADVSVVLSRVGSNISPEVRGHILTMVKNETLVQNQYLAFFIAKLIDAYESVKDLDQSMQEFAQVCNKYLINKELRYDRLNGNVKLFSRMNESILDFSGLSSGEKQLLGVMAQLYLSEKEKYAIIFDEPELSLSVEWQKAILPDLIQSGRCEFLVAATHSPFIFDNDLDAYASPLIAEYSN